MAETHAADAMPLVLSGVRRSWGPRSVIAGANLSVPRGAIAWVGGGNGVGKTTLLRIAAGLISPDDGEVSLLGWDPQRDRREYQRRLGWLPAGNATVYNRLTVRQNLAYWAAIAFIPRDRRQEAIEGAVEQFALEALGAKRADRISMGERQRLRVAMTFVHEPELVLLDEPHTSLDDNALERLSGALGRLATRGGAAVWCSPRREGTGLPATVDYRVEDGRLVAC